MNYKITKKELDRVIETYNIYHDVNRTAKCLNFSRSKTRKLLSCANICFSDKSKEIMNLFNQGYSIKQISNKLKLNIKTINEYVPYHNFNNSNSNISKKTIANKKSIQRKRVLENPEDIISLLKAFSEHRLYKYKYSDQGLLINNELIDFDDLRVKILVDRIIDDSKTR